MPLYEMLNIFHFIYIPIHAYDRVGCSCGRGWIHSVQTLPNFMLRFWFLVYVFVW